MYVAICSSFSGFRSLVGRVIIVFPTMVSKLAPAHHRGRFFCRCYSVVFTSVPTDQEPSARSLVLGRWLTPRRSMRFVFLRGSGFLRANASTRWNPFAVFCSASRAAFSSFFLTLYFLVARRSAASVRDSGGANSLTVFVSSFLLLSKASITACAEAP